jgi:hypothetical protein
MNAVELNELELIEALKDKRIDEVCDAVVEVAQQFLLGYCCRNDCQHVGNNSIAALKLKRRCGDLTIEELLPGRQYEFGILRDLMQQVLLPRELVRPGLNCYDRKSPVTDLKSYATADQFLELINSKGP